MARRGLKRNVSNEVRVEKLIEALEGSSPGPLAKALDDHDWRDIRRLPHGAAREEKFGELAQALQPLLIRVAKPKRQKKVEEKTARGRAGRDPGVSAAREAAAQRKTRKEVEASGHRARPRGSRRGMGAGSQIAEYTENVIIGRGYRGYSFEVEEIAPGKWDATVTYEPIVSIADGPTVKGEEFPVTSDPDLLISKVKERIDETLTWYAEKGIEPKRTGRRKPTPRRKVGREKSRRGERIEAVQEEIEAEARGETAAAAERFARSYVQFGYDPDASNVENISNMETKISALRDEIRVTREPSARRDLSELVDTIVSMVRRLKSGKSAFATTRSSRAGRNPGIKKPRRLTRKQLADLSKSSFALPSKRMFPIHSLAYMRVAKVDIESAHGKGKISDSDRNRAMKKAEKEMTAAIDRAISAEGNPSSLPFRTKKNPGFFSREEPALDAGRKWEKEYEKQVRRWMRSLDRRRADFDALMDAYDAVELARANYFLADDERKSEEMADHKRELRERIIEVLEDRGKKAVTREAEVVEAEFTEGPTSPSASASASAARSGIRAQGSGHKSAKVPSRSRKRSAARSGVFEQVSDNPTAKRHGKTGRDYLKKADEYWDKYYNKGKSKDLIEAYKYLTLAHEELKYAGDKEKLKEAKAGLNAATAELKLGLK